MFISYGEKRSIQDSFLSILRAFEKCELDTKEFINLTHEGFARLDERLDILEDRINNGTESDKT